MPAGMDWAGNQESQSATAVPAATSSALPLVGINWADANVPHSSLADASPTSPLLVVESESSKAHAFPSSRPNSEVYALPPSSSVLDRSTAVPAVNSFAMQFGCSPPFGNRVEHSYMHAKMHDPLSASSSTMEGSSLSENAAVHAVRRSYSDVSFASGNDVAHATWSPSVCMPKPSPPSRHEFLQSFVRTLLPELKRIHSQIPPVSLREKLSAVRLAADMSLAISAGGKNTWSQALFQNVASSSGSKVGVRRKNTVRKPNIPRSRIYGSILRKSSLRGGSHAMRLQSRSCSPCSKGSNLFASFSIRKDSSPPTMGLSANCSHASSDISASLSGGISHAMHCKTGSCVRRMRHARLKRRSGLSTYVKILRNSRPAMQSPAAPSIEASKAYTPPISKSKEHIASLGRLVPGGRSMDVPLLFQEAADYIRSLQMQVEALQSLSHFASL